jgi:hypothetical protein
MFGGAGLRRKGLKSLVFLSSAPPAHGIAHAAGASTLGVCVAT